MDREIDGDRRRRNLARAHRADLATHRAQHPLAERLDQAGFLVSAGVLPAQLALEITESVLMQDAAPVVAALETLRADGPSISIDDFGTGYSSLSYLRRLPVDALKIDRSFIRDIAEREDDAALTESIIRMARALRLRVVAEGVETEAQKALLTRFACDEIQGFLVARAMPLAEIEARLRGEGLVEAGSASEVDAS